MSTSYSSPTSAVFPDYLPQLSWSLRPLGTARQEAAQLPALSQQLTHLLADHHADPHFDSARAASTDPHSLFQCWSGNWVKIVSRGIAWQRFYRGRSAATQAQQDWQQLVSTAQFTPDLSVSGQPNPTPTSATSALASSALASPTSATLPASASEQAASSATVASPSLAPSSLSFPLALGSFSFAPAETSFLCVPASALLWCEDRIWLFQARSEIPPKTPPKAPKRPPETTKAASSPSDLTAEMFCDQFSFPATPALDPEKWQQAVAQATELIRAGRAEKIVLARDQIVQTDPPLPPAQVAARLAARYPTCWTYTIGDLVGATPEMLARVKAGNLLCRVLAGTCAPGHEDELWANPKEQLEHQIARDSIKDILAPVIANLQVSPEPFLLRLPNVSHLASDLSAPNLSQSALEIAGLIHPTAAVCGKPQAQAARYLSALEQMERGRYAGPVGWLDARGNGEWGLALRCAQIDYATSGRYRMLAGAGIMAESDPATEVREVEAKMQPLREALQSAPC